MELFREINSGRLDGALRLAHGWALEETPAQVHASGGGISRPTESRAINPSRKDPTEQVLRSMLETVDTAVKDLVKMSRDTQPITGQDAIRFKQRLNAQAHTLAPCASVLCPDDAPVNHRHCEACAAYLDSHPGVTQVPRSTISERAKKRKQREAGRLHVTGPLVEEIA